MYELSLAEVRQLRQRLKRQLIPKGNLIFNILKYIIGYLMLRDTYEVVFALKVSPLAQPDRVILVHPYVAQF